RSYPDTNSLASYFQISFPWVVSTSTLSSEVVSRIFKIETPGLMGLSFVIFDSRANNDEARIKLNNKKIEVEE
ncbi:MAG: hypothetical protein K2K65_07945, partial [Duncaniella sp.]|nr:hypothetical protein [Duncaniella sp.]